MQLAAQSVGDILSIGGVTTLLGLGMTFIVLGLLIGCIFLLEYFLKKLSLVLAKRNQPKSSDLIVEEVVPSNALDTSVTVEPISDSTRRAITEAITMFSQYDDKDKKPHKNITIKSIVEID